MVSIQQIAQARDLIKKADAIVVGIGAGMSAAGGLNYVSPDLVKKWYPEYYELGFTGLFPILCEYWQIHYSTPERFWSYWARHIKNIRYDYPLTQPYKDLYEILKNKKYFTILTNADGQYQKSKLDQNRLFAPQGNYQYLQCEVPCCDALYDSKPYVEKMVKNMPDKFSVRTEDIPICPKCGHHLVPNLRCDNTFVEKPHMKKMQEYRKFISDNEDKNLLFLELGVGFNSPGVIRTPFDYMTYSIPNARLLRINFNDDEVPVEIAEKTLMIKGDIAEVLQGILAE